MILFNSSACYDLSQANKLQYPHHGHKREWALRSNLAVSVGGCVCAKFWRFRAGPPEMMMIGIWKWSSSEKRRGRKYRLPDQHNDRLLVSFLSWPCLSLRLRDEVSLWDWSLFRGLGWAAELSLVFCYLSHLSHLHAQGHFLALHWGVGWNNFVY